MSLRDDVMAQVASGKDPTPEDFARRNGDAHHAMMLAEWLDGANKAATVLTKVVHAAPTGAILNGMLDTSQRFMAAGQHAQSAGLVMVMGNVVWCKTYQAEGDNHKLAFSVGGAWTRLEDGGVEETLTVRYGDEILGRIVRQTGRAVADGPMAFGVQLYLSAPSLVSPIDTTGN